jgi:hypothetical protein
MRHFSFLCVTLLSVNHLSLAQTQPTPAPAASRSDAGGFGIYTHVNTRAPYLAMTFDDGPSAEYTPRLLDMLKARHIKATFFLVGKNVQAHPELVRRSSLKDTRWGTTLGIILSYQSFLMRKRQTKSKRPRTQFERRAV